MSTRTRVSSLSDPLYQALLTRNLDGAPQPLSSVSYKAGVCFDHRNAVYQPNTKAIGLNRAERATMFEGAFVQNPNGLGSEEEYRRLAYELGITVHALKSR